MDKTINLIWQTKNGDATTFEYEYITEILFKNYKQNKIFDDATYKTILNNSVVIYSKDNEDKTPISKEFTDYLDKFLEKNYNFYLLHLSNEHQGHDCWYYTKAKHVFRNYYFEDIDIKYDNVKFLPLGFKSGYIGNYKENLNTNEKEFDFSFIGAIKSDRHVMLNNIIKYKHFIHRTHRWNCPTSMSQKDVRQIYKKTKFVPCPMGNVHVDSFRICESLESGSIPVIKLYNNEDYSNIVFPNNPFPKVKDWDEIGNLLNIDYIDLYKNVLNFYEEFKINLNKEIITIIK